MSGSTQRSSPCLDAEETTRLARRVVIGAAAGLVAGLVIAAVAMGLFEAAAGPTLASLSIAGSIIGGLVGLYSRLSMNTQLFDVDTGQESTVRVDVYGLDEDKAKALDNLLGHS